MFGNYLLTAWRGILREPFFAAVNVCGLAVGLACCILMLLFVRHETGYDTDYEDAGRLYQVRLMDKHDTEAGQTVRVRVRFPVELLNDAPSMRSIGIEEVVMYTFGHRPLHFKTETSPGILSEDYLIAGGKFFQLLNRPFITGNAQDALSTVDAAVIARSLALALYGTDQALGKVLTTDRKIPLTIHGVIEDFPLQSHIRQRLFTRTWPTTTNRTLEVSGNEALIRLSPGAKIEEVAARLDAAYQAMPKSAAVEKLGLGLRIEARALPAIHLDDTALQIMGSNGKVAGSLSNERLVITATFLAVLVLIIAITNFINMTIARSQQRRREIATRKALGASRAQLIVQYLAEAMVLTFIAFIVAISLVEILMPGFNVLVDRALTTAPMFQPDMAAALILLVVTVGLLAGFYPAWVLSGLPAVVSQATPVRNRRLPLRQVLVFGQFLVTSFLIVIAITAHRQVELFRDRDFGFDTDVQIAAVEFSSWTAFLESARDPTNSTDQWATMAQRIQGELIRQPAIADVSASGLAPGNYPPFVPIELMRAGAPDAQSVPVGADISVDEHFLDVYSLPLLAGRNFSPQHPSDRTRMEDSVSPEGAVQTKTTAGGLLLTASAARKLGFLTPQSAIGARLTSVRRSALVPPIASSYAYTVIGVTGDMLMGDGLGGMPAGVFVLNDERNLYFAIKPKHARAVEAARQARETLKRVAPGLVFSVDFLPETLERSLKPLDRLTTGFVGYALLAIVISCLGLYAMTAFMMARRAREVGVRKALGATTGQVTALLGWDLTRPVALALILALPAGFFAGNYLLQPFTERVIIGFSILGLTALISLLVAWLTVSRQSLRLAATRPYELLRYE